MMYSASKQVKVEEEVPQSTCLKFIKYSLLLSLIILIILALIVLIVSETNSKQKPGIIALVGLVIFLIGLFAVIKEHIPSLMVFAVSIIFYLLLFMYSRVLKKYPGLIILRTLVALTLAIEAVCLAIMIRDWRQLRRSRINAKMMVANQRIYESPYGHKAIYGYQYYTTVPLHKNASNV